MIQVYELRVRTTRSEICGLGGASAPKGSPLDHGEPKQAGTGRTAGSNDGCACHTHGTHDSLLRIAGVS
jgi:hypothetical protein